MKPYPEDRQTRGPAERGAAIAAYHQTVCRDDVPDDVTSGVADIMADLFHYLDQHKCDHEVAVNQARRYYEADMAYMTEE